MKNKKAKSVASQVKRRWIPTLCATRTHTYTRTGTGYARKRNQWQPHGQKSISNICVGSTWIVKIIKFDQRFGRSIILQWILYVMLYNNTWDKWHMVHIDGWIRVVLWHHPEKIKEELGKSVSRSVLIIFDSFTIQRL